MTTTDERKDWAYQNLDRFLRDIEITEFMDAYVDVSRLEERVCDLENAIEDLSKQAEALREENTSLDTRLDALTERLDVMEEDDEDPPAAHST